MPEDTIIRAGEPTEDKAKTRKEKILARARARFRRGKTHKEENCKAFDKDIRFVAGDQWTQEEKNNRMGRPCPVVNVIRQQVRIVCNDMRQNRPGPKVTAKDGTEPDEDLRLIQEGLLRDIENSPGAEAAFDSAEQYQVTGGFGYYGLTIDYADLDTSKKAIKLRRFHDPTCVVEDCDAVELDGSDWEWAFVRQKFSRDRYESKFGRKLDASGKYQAAGYAAFNFFAGDERNQEEFGDWLEGDGSIWLAEYWEIEKRPRTLVGLKDGSEEWEDELSGEDRNQIDTTTQPIQKDYPYLTQYFIDGIEIHEETPFPLPEIPVYPCYGDELYICGKRVFFSLIRSARDPQEAINYIAALWMEALSLAPKPKWIGALGQFATQAAKWRSANRSTDAALEYDPVSIAGTPAPPPVWQAFNVSVAEYSTAVEFWMNAVQAAVGQYQPSLGAIDPKEQSGKAIGLLQQQGSIAVNHFADNAIQTRKRFYRNCLELIPQVYDEAQEVRIIGADQKAKVVLVNQEFIDHQGRVKRFDLNARKYAVTVSVGPSYASRRMAALDFANNLLKADPALYARIGWLAIKMADLGPEGEQMAKLIEPPDVALQDKGMDPQAAQLQGQVQQLQQQLQMAMQVIEGKKVEEGAKYDREMAKLNLNYRIELMRENNALRIAAMQAKNEEGLQLAENQMKRDLAAMGYSHEAVMQAHAQAHEAGMAAEGHSQALEQNEQQTDHAQASQQSEQDFQEQQQQNQPEQAE